jgi:hypothetical protein
VNPEQCTDFSRFFTGKSFANMGRLTNLRARVQKSIGDVCVKKISATSKFLELKKLNEEKISRVIFIIADCYLTAQK